MADGVRRRRRQPGLLQNYRISMIVVGRNKTVSYLILRYRSGLLARVQFYHQINFGLLPHIFLPMQQPWILLRTQNGHRTVTKTPKCEEAQEGEPVDQANVVRRYRSKNGRLARKYGNTYIRTLRAKYGEGFAPGERAERKLIDVLHHLDDQSLSRLIEGLSGSQIR